MGIEQEALKFANQLKEKYFVTRNIPALLDDIDHDISWLGTGENEISHNWAEAKEALLKEYEEYSGNFQIIEESLHSKALSNNCCLVYGTLNVKPADKHLDSLSLHVSLICRNTEDSMKLIHCNFGKPDMELHHGQYYVPADTRANTDMLKEELKHKEIQLENLTANIPGGVHQCANDKGLTLLNMSDGFLKMFGYSKEEINALFQGRFLNMIYPPDRPAVQSAIKKQLKKGPSIELEYRILCKNHDPIWILDKGILMDDGSGKKSFYCILIEITERKCEQEELRLSLERHTVIMDQATDIIFEWDIEKDTLLFSNNWEKKFGYEPVRYKISKKIPLSINIHPDDVSAFVKLMRDTADGIPYPEAEFRIRNCRGGYIWCRIRATTQFDMDHRPIKAVGVIVDITSEKKERQLLIDMALKDPLTGLYNKSALRAQIEEKMQGIQTSSMQGLLIIDIDNFKTVNDTYGHLCGDFILTSVATALRQIFCDTELIGRIGGDKFMVYIPDIKGEKAAADKLNSLLLRLGQIEPERRAACVSCSIGVVLTPRGTSSYLKMYRSADQALYYRKAHGKNGFSFYQSSLSSGPGNDSIS